jgi:hypothetical protein
VGQQGEYVRVKSQPVFCEAAIGGVVLSIKDFHADQDHQSDDNQKDREAGHLGSHVLRGLCNLVIRQNPS